MLQSSAYVPEMILDLPREIKKLDGARLVRTCVGVAFVRLYRAGCIVTVRGGNGVVVKKKADGTFSAPVSLQMLGPAIGASIGFEMSDFVIFFKTDAAIDSFVTNVGTVGVNGSLAAGPLGREAEAFITSGSKEGFVVFANSKGLYGGVSVEFSGVLVDKSANAAQYGRPISPQEIFDEPQPKGESFEKMYKALTELMEVPVEEDEVVDEVVDETEDVIAQQ